MPVQAVPFSTGVVSLTEARLLMLLRPSGTTTPSPWSLPSAIPSMPVHIENTRTKIHKGGLFLSLHTGSGPAPWIARTATRR